MKRLRKYRSRRIIGICLGILLIVVGGLYLYNRPLPAINISSSLPVDHVQQPKLDWPLFGQSAIAADGYGMLGTSGSQTPLPTASTAKLITALCVLSKYPLSVNQPGPIITISASDVALYNQYVAENGSVVAVTAGEQLSEYQALEAMLLPSANNIADTLAIWAFGSMGNYQNYATTQLAGWGLNQTTIGGDASGFLPTTLSTATDLTTLGLRVIHTPVLAKIVAEQQATIPVAGLVTNYNPLLGQYDVVGVKTGNNDQDKGVYVFAANTTISGQPLTLVGADMGADSLADATAAAPALLVSSEAAFSLRTLVNTSQTIGSYRLPWNNQSDQIVTSQSFKLLLPLSTLVTYSTSFKPLHNGQVAGSVVGTLRVGWSNQSKEIPLVLNHSLASPPWWWRLFRHRL